MYIPTRSGPPESKIVRSSNVRFDEGGLITKPLPYKNDTENDSTPAGATGEESGNQDQQSSDLLPSQTPTAVEVDSDDPVTDMDSDHEDQEEVETELLPEITQIDQSEDELPPPKRRQHKVHIPNPEFDRRTRQTTRRQAESSSSQNPNPNILNTALFTALKAGPTTSIYDDPETIEEAKLRPDWLEWEKAIQKEYRGLKHKGTWKMLKRNTLPPGTSVIPGRLVLRTKRDKDNNIQKRKARWVAKGFRQQYGRDFDQTYAGVCKTVTWKLAVAIAALFDLEIDQMDVTQAFLNSKADTEIYVEVPPEWKIDEMVMTDSPNRACKLIKALYGLKQAPRLW